MIRRSGRRRRKADQGEQEAGWGEKPPAPRIWLWVFFAVAVLFLILVAVVIPSRSGEDAEVEDGVPGNTVEVQNKRLEDGMLTAQAVAEVFLSEGDSLERLRWVRNADEVHGRRDRFSEEAREAPGEIERMIGHVDEGGRTVTAFAVAMPSGGMRLLEVVETEKGPKVDWDAYARHGTASWEDLGSGKAERAMVRVFCEPSRERPEPFGNQAEWTAFRLSSPDLPQAALGFAQAGSVREKMMKKVILGTPRYRQRFTLEVVRHEGEDEALFEIKRCLAVGWILGDTDVEELWSE